MTEDQIQQAIYNNFPDLKPEEGFFAATGDVLSRVAESIPDIGRQMIGGLKTTAEVERREAVQDVLDRAGLVPPPPGIVRREAEQIAESQITGMPRRFGTGLIRTDPLTGEPINPNIEGEVPAEVTVPPQPVIQDKGRLATFLQYQRERDLQPLRELQRELNRPLAEIVAEMQQIAQRIQGRRPEGAKGVAYDVLTTTAKMIPSISAGLAARNPNVTLGMMYGQVYGERLADMLSRGLDPDTARVQAHAGAAIETLTEKIPLDILFSRIGREGIRKLIDFTVAEGLQEGASSLLLSAWEKGTIDPNKTLGEALREAGYETLVGGLAAPLIGGPAIVAQRIGRRRTPDQAPVIQDQDVRTPEQILEELQQAEPGAQRVDIPETKTQPTAAEIQPETAPEAVSERPPEQVQTNVPRGTSTKISTPDGMEIEAGYDVVELDSLIPSHKESGRPNEEYPSYLQPRQRDRVASQAQIEKIARTLRPELLGESPYAGEGAPIVSPDGVVESGNGRVLALRKAYRIGTGEKYKQFLKDNAQKFGLDPSQIEGMKNPVLVRVRTTPLSEEQRAAFAQQANRPTVAPMSAAEQANADAQILTDEDIMQFRPDDDGNVLSPSNQEFMRRFASRIGQDAGGLLTPDGRWTKQAADRVTAAMFAKAYDDPNLVQIMAEEADPVMRNVLRALTIAAPDFARARALAPDLGGIDLPGAIAKAADLVRQSRTQRRALSEILGQQGLFDQGIESDVAQIARLFDENPRSPRRMAHALKTMAQALNSHLEGRQTADLFGQEAPTTEQIVQRGQEAIDETQGTLFADRKVAEGRRSVREQDERQRAEIDAEGIRRQVEELTKNWKGAPEIVVVDRVQDLPGENPPDTDGLWEDGKVWLVAENIPTAKRAVETVLHEVVGHDGIRGLLGDRMNKVLDGIWQAHEQGKLSGRDPYFNLDQIAREYEIDTSTVDGRREVAEEYLARLAERDVRNNWLTKIVVMLRNWLRKIMPSMSFSRSDLVEIVAEARKTVETGKPVEKGIASRLLRRTTTESPSAQEQGVEDERFKIMGVELMQDLGINPPRPVVPDNHPLLIETISKPGRDQIHTRIIENYISKMQPAEGQPVAVLMGGGGASGKGFVLKSLQEAGMVPRDAVVIDPDEVKTQIPEYQELLKRNDYRAASVVHEESSQLSKNVLDEAIKRQSNVVIDKTMGNPDKAAAEIKRLKNAGYKVILFGVSADTRVALDRMAKRYQRTGRFVRIPDMLAAHKGFSSGFERIAALSDEAYLFDTSQDRQARLIAAKTDGGSLDIIDYTSYNMFRRKSRINPNARRVDEIEEDAGGPRPAEAGIRAVPQGAGEAGGGTKAQAGAQAQPASYVPSKRVKRSIRLQEADLPEDHNLYFDLGINHETVPLDKLKLSKDEAELSEREMRALANMLRAEKGEIPKREPITVRKVKDGYEVLDGNATTQVLKSAGWESVPVRIVDKRYSRPKESMSDALSEDRDIDRQSFANWWKENVGDRVWEKLDAGTKALLGNKMLKSVGLNLYEDVPKEFKIMMRRFRAQVMESGVVAEEFMKASRDMTPQEREMISDYIEGELKAGVVPPERIVEIGNRMRSAMDAQADELVKLGMLSRESRERWRGKYLPRYYSKHLFTSPFDKMLRAAYKKIDGSHLKGRGLFEAVKKRDIEKYKKLGWEIRGQEQIDIGNLRDEDTVIMWRDFTKKERERMGEIRDAAYRFARGYVEIQKDIAMGRLFKNVAERIARDVQPAEDWVQVPDTTIPNTGGLKRFGALAGKWVPSDVMASLEATRGETSDLMRAYLKALSAWKAGKTALNPVVHGNNVISTIVMADLAGVHLYTKRGVDLYRKAMREYLNKGNDYLEARKAGLFGTEFYAAEIKEMLPELTSEVSPSEISSAIMRRMTKILSTTGKPAKWYMQKMSRLYEAEDQFFKMLLYLDARSRGESVDSAIDWAEKWVFNYADIPPGVRKIKTWALPFFSYTYKAVPALTYAAVYTPWRFVPWIALFNGMNWFAYSWLFGADADDKEEFERKVIPEYMRGYTVMLTPKVVRWPANTDDGQALFLDLSRRMPLGDIFDANNQAGGLPILQPLMPNNPILNIMAGMIWNIDTFTGKKVVKDHDDAWNAAVKRSAWIYRQLAPNTPVLPGTYSWNKVMNGIAASTGEPLVVVPGIAEYTGKDYFGREQSLPRSLADTLTGTKIRAVDVDKEQRMRILELNRQLKGLMFEKASVARSKSKTPRIKRKEIDDINSRIKIIRDKMQEMRAR